MLAVLEVEVGEDVGMAADHLGRGQVHGFGHSPAGGALDQFGGEEQQEEDVPDLLEDLVHHGPVLERRLAPFAGPLGFTDGAHQLEGLLHDVVAEAGRGLLAVPGAAVRPDEPQQDVAKL